MKTMKLGDEIKRVCEKEADSYLNRGYSYIPKSEWKEKVRGSVKQKVEKTEEVTEKKTKRGKN